MADDNLIKKGASGGILSPPLVSLVLINWNYASFVGATIDSIKAQDYPWFEALIIDNGSTDESLGVITKHVAGDSRFRVIRLEENLGQLGAFLEVFEELKGDFVSIVDADDVIFSNFVSSHIQVHLALPFSVALTSSNVVEMTTAGRAITGSYAAFGSMTTPESRGLRTPPTAVRLPAISEIDYQQLSDATRTFVDINRWIWGPGTSNMFRRSVLSLVHYKPEGRIYLRAADNYLCPFCHIFGGSALVDKPLSAYRIHGSNYFAERESIRGVRKDRGVAAERLKRDSLQMLDILFARAETFQKVLDGDSFWKAADQLTISFRNGRRKFAVSTDEAAPFVDNYETLRRIFGEDALLAQLIQRLRLDALHTVLRIVSDGKIPARLRARLLFLYARSTLRIAISSRFGPQSLMRHAKLSLPAVLLKRGHKAPPVEEIRSEYGPVARLSLEPPIFLTGIAFEEYIGIAPSFGKVYGTLPAGFLIYPCWTIDNEYRADRVIRAAREHQEKYPSHELIFICNTSGERDRLLFGVLMRIS